jgi:hypothetical protein
MRFACWITKATNTHSENVILIAFPQQNLFRVISCLYLHRLSCYLCEDKTEGFRGGSNIPVDKLLPAWFPVKSFRVSPDNCCKSWRSLPTLSGIRGREQIRNGGGVRIRCLTERFWKGESSSWDPRNKSMRKRVTFKEGFKLNTMNAPACNSFYFVCQFHNLSSFWQTVCL